MPISATTELLGEHPELLDIAIADIEDGQITSWVRGGDGLIGFGVYKSHTVKGPDRFEKARSWWRAEINSLNIANNSHSSGSGPILFTSFSFDEAEDSILIIPRGSIKWQILDYLDG
jgi:menaquinone-specific isochorismate synthase